MALTAAASEAWETPTTDDDLSDERIEELLSQAETKLRNQVATPNTNTQQLQHMKTQQSNFPTPPAQSKHGITRIESQHLVSDEHRKLANSTRSIEDPVMVRKKRVEDKKASAGPSWYNLPRTDLTPQLKRDFQVLRMRNVLDPKRHYKKENSRAHVPEFSQVGTLVEGPTEFYSARVPVRERKRTLVEQVLAGEKEEGRFKRKYMEIQGRKRSGKQGEYKEAMKRRYKKGLKR